MKFKLEELEAAVALIASVNATNLAELELVNGEASEPVYVPDPVLIKMWQFIGFNNIDFIKMRLWEEPNRSNFLNSIP